MGGEDKEDSREERNPDDRDEKEFHRLIEPQRGCG
jgi:hypothetical protein